MTNAFFPSILCFSLSLLQLLLLLLLLLQFLDFFRALPLSPPKRKVGKRRWFPNDSQLFTAHVFAIRKQVLRRAEITKRGPTLSYETKAEEEDRCRRKRNTRAHTYYSMSHAHAHFPRSPRFQSTQYFKPCPHSHPLSIPLPPPLFPLGSPSSFTSNHTPSPPPSLPPSLPPIST